MNPTPQPFTLSFIVLLFSLPRPPSLPSAPSLPSPNLPSIQGPNFQAPSFQGPSLNGTSLQGPSFQGPQVQGPSYSGPGYQGRAGSTEAGKRAGFWLGVLIFLWSLAIVALIVLVLYLAGVNVNPFNFQKYKAQDVLTGFTNAGLEVTKPVVYSTTNGFGNQAVPFNYQDGANFTVPSSGPGGTGGITSFTSGSELDKAKAFLADPSKNNSITYRIYTKDNILIYFNVTTEAKAKQYEATLLSLK